MIAAMTCVAQDSISAVDRFLVPQGQWSIVIDWNPYTWAWTRLPHRQLTDTSGFGIFNLGLGTEWTYRDNRSLRLMGHAALIGNNDFRESQQRLCADRANIFSQEMLRMPQPYSLLPTRVVNLMDSTRSGEQGRMIFISNEEYGWLLSVYKPVYDSNGVCKCYIGADCSMEGLREYTRKVIGEVCCFALVAMVIVLAVGIFVTDRSVIRKMDKLEDRAYVDTLTGLQNRTAFYEYIGALNKKREAGYEDFSILMIDVNFLKRVNDTYGHEEGNIYLQGAAELMAKVFGRDCLYRIGGDEFVQILEGKAQDGVEDRIRTFNEEVKKLQADDSLKPWEKVSAAVGIAKYDKGRDATAEETFRRADEAMYREKVAVKAIRTDT